MLKVYHALYEEHDEAIGKQILHKNNMSLSVVNLSYDYNEGDKYCSMSELVRTAQCVLQVLINSAA